MARTLALTPFGTYHMDTPGKVTRELDEVAAGADVIFVEYPDRTLTAGEFASALLRAPVSVVGLLVVQLLIHLPLFLLFNRDLLPTEIVAIRRVVGDGDVPVHRVDDPIMARLCDVGPLMIAGNWLVLAVVAWLGPVGAAVTGLLVLVGVAPMLVRRTGRRVLAIGLTGLWYLALAGTAVLGYLSVPLLVVGFFAFVVVARVTLAHRNRHMLDEIAAIADERGYEDAVLVTGKAHLAGLARRADERALSLPSVHVSMWRSPGVTVRDVDPAALPESGDMGLDVPGSSRPVVVPGSEGSVFGKRLLAGAIDLCVTVGVAAAVVLLAIFWPEEGGASIGAGEAFVGLLVLTPVAALLVETFLRPLAEVRVDVMPGKRLVGLAVADADDHGAPSTRAVLVRGLLRAVDGFGFYAVGALAAAVSDRGQRLGDRAAGTVVGLRNEQEGRRIVSAGGAESSATGHGERSPDRSDGVPAAAESTDASDEESVDTSTAPRATAAGETDAPTTATPDGDDDVDGEIDSEDGNDGEDDADVPDSWGA